MDPQPQPFDLHPRPARSAPPAAARRIEHLTRVAAAHGWAARTHIAQPDLDQPPSRVEFTASHPEVAGAVLIRWDIDPTGYRMTVCRAPLGRKGRTINVTYRRALVTLATPRALSRGLEDPQAA